MPITKVSGSIWKNIFIALSFLVDGFTRDSVPTKPSAERLRCRGADLHCSNQKKFSSQDAVKIPTNEKKCTLLDIKKGNK